MLVNTGYPGATITQTGTLTSVILQNPLAGQWSVSVQGVNVPEGTTNYNVLFSSRANPNPPSIIATPSVYAPSGSGFPLTVILIVLAGAGVIVYAAVISGKRSKDQLGSAARIPGSLIGLNGMYAGRSIPLRDEMLIGRGTTCTLRLTDPSVSRRHAQIRFAGGRWYIEDLNSGIGTYINGAKLPSTPLSPGDRIRIGSAEFEFRY